jgi:hypothetical protein
MRSSGGPTYGRPLVAGNGVRVTSEFGALFAVVSARAGVSTGVKSGVWSLPSRMPL